MENKQPDTQSNLIKITEMIINYLNSKPKTKGVNLLLRGIAVLGMTIITCVTIVLLNSNDYGFC